MSNSLRCHGRQHTRLPCPSPSPWVCSNSCPLSWWCSLNISSSVTHFSCPQSFPASGSFPVSQLFTSGGQSIGASVSVSVLPMNIQCWLPLGLTGLVNLWIWRLSVYIINNCLHYSSLFSPFREGSLFINYVFPTQFILRYFIPFLLILIVSYFNYSSSQVSSGSQEMLWFVYIFLTYNQIDPNVFSYCSVYNLWLACLYSHAKNGDFPPYFNICNF